MNNKKKRSYKKLSCLQCISFAICKSRNTLKCSLLYDYMFDYHITPPNSTFYHRINRIRDTFDRRHKDYQYSIDSKNRFIIYWTITKRKREYIK